MCRTRNHPAETAGDIGRVVDPGVNRPFVESLRQAAKEPADPAAKTDQSIPEVAVEKIGEPRREAREGKDCPIVKLIEPHPIFEETKKRRERALDRIDLGSVAINQNSKTNPGRDEDEGEIKSRLDEQREVESRPFAKQILVQPRPGRRQDHAENNRANSPAQ